MKIYVHYITNIAIIHENIYIFSITYLNIKIISLISLQLLLVNPVLYITAKHEAEKGVCNNLLYCSYIADFSIIIVATINDIFGTLVEDHVTRQKNHRHKICNLIIHH